MKFKTVTQILAGVLSFGMFVPSSIYAAAVTQPTDALAHFAKNFNHTVKNWAEIQKSPREMQREFKQLGVHFNSAYEAQDKKYFNLLASEVPELLPVRASGDHYEFFKADTNAVALTVKSLGNNKFQFNGKDFEYNLNQSLEANLAQVKTLLTPPKGTASILDGLFLPRAEAEISTGMLIAIGAVLAFAAGFVLVTALKRNSPEHAEDAREKIRNNSSHLPGAPGFPN